MRILYLALSYVPSRRASSVQVMKMCSALARRGHEVRLVVKRGASVGIDDHAYYCVEPNFMVDKLARPPRRGGGLVYAMGMAARVTQQRRWADVAYCRDQIGTMLSAQANIPLVFEAHDVPQTWWRRTAIAHAVSRRKSIGIVAISDALRRDLIAARIAPPDRRIVVAHDGCDPPAVPTTRRRLGERPIVGYVGGLYPGRGIELIARLASAMPHVVFRIVGGSEADLARWRATQPPTNLELIGFRPQADLPGLYASMNIVLMPYARDGILSETRGAIDTSRWTSPMKMFEYMASGAAIISSDLPVLREVLRDEENAILVPADDLIRWRVAIERLIGDDELRFRLAQTAQLDLMQRFTWDVRAAAIMKGLGLESSSH